jgi:hypothetical protein
LAVTIDPEEASVNRTLVGFPSGRYRTDELYESLGQDSLSVPEAILKIEIP